MAGIRPNTEPHQNLKTISEHLDKCLRLTIHSISGSPVYKRESCFKRANKNARGQVVQCFSNLALQKLLYIFV